MQENEQPQSSQVPTDENPITEQAKTHIFQRKFTIAIAGAVLVFIAIAAFFLFFNKNDNPEQPATTEQEAREETTTATDETIQQTELAIDRHILFVKDGDLWQMSANGANAVKLIDLDTVQRASRSPVSNRIAYTLRRGVTETVTEHDGTVRDVEVSKQQLLLAGEKGSDSFLVHDNVARWGWIPSTDLLWYETATLQQSFDWGYGGDGNVWIFNPTTRKSEKFIHDDSDYWSLLRAEWSPDGNKLMFASGDVLRVADRRTKAITRIFQLPYVGGDRGGPQPIPYFAWTPDSSSIYAIFSPFLISGEKQNPDVALKAQHITALRFSLDGSKPTKLIPEASSTIINEESYPRAHFSDDFSKAIYPRTMQGGTNLILAMYDLTEQKEYVLLENLGEPKRGLMPDGVPLAWVVGDSVYIFRGDGDWLYDTASIALIKVNYRTGTTETLASRDGISSHISNTLFVPESETLFFTSGGKLYSMNRGGVVPIADELGDFSQVEYHV